MVRFGNIRTFHLRRIATTGAVAAVWTVMLLRGRLNVIEFTLLLVGTALMDAFGPQRAAEGLNRRSRNPPRELDEVRSSLVRRVLRSTLTLVLGGYAITAAVVLLASAASLSIPVATGTAVSGAVALIVGAQIAVAVWLWMRRRQPA